MKSAFRLPPTWITLGPADAIRLARGERQGDLQPVSIADRAERGTESVRKDRATYGLPRSDPRAATLTGAVVCRAPDTVLVNLPPLAKDRPPHRPPVARPRRSPAGQDRAFPRPVDRRLQDLILFGGANALAVESTLGKWEIVQAGAAELIASGRYRLTRLLRGQRGTEAAMGNPTPAGARVVVLDATLASLPIAEVDLGLPWNWRVGPAARAVSDDSYAALGFTPTGRGLVPFAPVHVEQPW